MYVYICRQTCKGTYMCMYVYRDTHYKPAYVCVHTCICTYINTYMYMY